MTRTRAAASSSARGRPSSRAQISAIARALSGVSAKSERVAVARSTKSATDGHVESETGSAASRMSGSASGGTANSCSPDRLSTTRLVAITFRVGHAASRDAMSPAASMTCSKLSSSSRTRPSSARTWSASASRTGRAPMSRTRSEEHTSELQSQSNLVCRLLLEKKKKIHASAGLNGPHTLLPALDQISNRYIYSYYHSRYKQFSYSAQSSSMYSPTETFHTLSC